jgi:hypothetical protein
MAGVKTDQSRTTVGRRAAGGVYAGNGGTVSKEDQGGGWQKNAGNGREMD